MQWLQLQECTRRATPVGLRERGSCRSGSRRSGQDLLHRTQGLQLCVCAFRAQRQHGLACEFFTDDGLLPADGWVMLVLGV